MLVSRTLIVITSPFGNFYSFFATLQQFSVSSFYISQVGLNRLISVSNKKKEKIILI